MEKSICYLEKLTYEERYKLRKSIRNKRNNIRLVIEDLNDNYDIRYKKRKEKRKQRKKMINVSTQTQDMSTQTQDMSTQTQDMSTQTQDMSTQTQDMSTQTQDMSTQIYVDVSNENNSKVYIYRNDTLEEVDKNNRELLLKRCTKNIAYRFSKISKDLATFLNIEENSYTRRWGTMKFIKRYIYKNKLWAKDGGNRFYCNKELFELFGCKNICKIKHLCYKCNNGHSFSGAWLQDGTYKNSPKNENDKIPFSAFIYMIEPHFKDEITQNDIHNSIYNLNSHNPSIDFTELIHINRVV